MLTVTEQILFTMKNSNKMLTDVNTLVKKPIEHKTLLYLYIYMYKHKI